jgi:hypothetical protein
MNDFNFKAALRFFGASFDPVILSDILNMTPAHMWKAGERRRTPKGTELEGWREQSYCSFDIDRHNGEDLSATLHRMVSAFTKHKTLFKDLRTDNIRIEIFVGWFSPGNTGSTLSCKLMSKLGALGIDLALDVYGSEADIC